MDLEQAKREYIDDRITKLIDEDEFCLLVECDQKAADAIRKLCRASTSMELNEAQAEINDMIRDMANVVAERDWQREAPRVFFELQEAA